MSGANLRDRYDRLHITVTMIAQRSGVHENTVRTALKHESRVIPATRAAIARALAEFEDEAVAAIASSRAGGA